MHTRHLYTMHCIIRWMLVCTLFSLFAFSLQFHRVGVESGRIHLQQSAFVGEIGSGNLELARGPMAEGKKKAKRKCVSHKMRKRRTRNREKVKRARGERKKSPFTSLAIYPIPKSDSRRANELTGQSNYSCRREERRAVCKITLFFFFFLLSPGLCLALHSPHPRANE